MHRRTIAVIGGGISGLSAAWLLSRRHKVTLYDAAPEAGGHAHTVSVGLPDGPVSVDTGFIVFNESNYPNLVALFRYLGVETQATEMRFAFSADNGAYEYSGSGALGFFGQPGNLARPAHWKLLFDIERFFRTAAEHVERYPGATTLGEFLQAEGYGQGFAGEHIIPMGAAIWSTPADTMLAFPARAFVEFYKNHGMLQFRNRPLWHTVSGGSARYVNRLVADGNFELVTSRSIRAVRRASKHVRIEDDRGVVRPFDDVVMATPADEALRLLADADENESDLLGAFAYQRNKAVLHSDWRMMPKRRRLWSSWNYLHRRDGEAEHRLCVTYWMNLLQNLSCSTDLFVTLNPTEDIHPKAVRGVFDYAHPVFDAGAMVARESLWSLQGRKRTWFCGSYFGFGFHEDGLQSGLAVAEQLGGVSRPWTVPRDTARICAGPNRQEAAA